VAALNYAIGFCKNENVLGMWAGVCLLSGGGSFVLAGVLLIVADVIMHLADVVMLIAEVVMQVSQGFLLNAY